MNQNSMFLVYFLCVVFNIFSIGIGRLFLSNSAPDINYVIGFRTKLATKNNRNWEFANKLFGRYLYRIGLINLILTVIFIIINQKLTPELNEILAVILAISTSLAPVFMAIVVHFKLKSFDRIKE